MAATLTCLASSFHPLEGIGCHSYFTEPRSEHHFDLVAEATLVVLEVLRK